MDSVNKIGAFFILFLFFTLVVPIFFLIFLSIYLSNYPSSRFDPKQQYQAVEINMFSGLRKTGSAHLPRPLNFGLEEYFTFSNFDEGTTSILSHFGGTNYECQGSCICSKKSKSFSKRRSTTTLLTRNLVLLLSAFSSTMALQVAEDAFSDQCSQHFSCPTEDEEETSQVERCSEAENGNSDDPPYNKRINCRGNCELNVPFCTLLEHVTSKYETRGLRKWDVCEEIVLEKEFEIRKEDFESLPSLIGSTLRTLGEKEMIRGFFARRYLQPFCEGATVLMFDDEDLGAIYEAYEDVTVHWPWEGKDTSGFREGFPYCSASFELEWDPELLLEEKYEYGLHNIVCTLQ